MHFCATCDGPFYRGKEVLVVGGGNSAGEESLFLTQVCQPRHHRYPGRRPFGQQVRRRKSQRTSADRLAHQRHPEEFKGDTHLETVVLRNATTGETTEITPKGVFVFIGLKPNTQIVKDLVMLDERGFIVTDGMLQTSVPGIFAAGDARADSTKQAASAAGEGAAVALALRRYIEPLASGMPKHGKLMEEPVMA